jgi:hypothetical protein
MAIMSSGVAVRRGGWIGVLLSKLLLLIAFRDRICVSDLAAGLSRFEEILERSVNADDFRGALDELMSSGDVREPVRLPPGALQCYWRCEPTPEGASKIMAFLQENGMTADEMIAQAVRSGEPRG